MGITIDPEAYKPLKCKECGSTKIANMLNEGVIRCLDCGKEKTDPNSIQEIMRRESGRPLIYTTEPNPKPHRDF